MRSPFQVSLKINVCKVNDKLIIIVNVLSCLKHAGGYRFLARPEFGDLLKKLLAPKIRKRLSSSLLEVLAVIAYNQPVSRGEIQQIRGSSPDYALDRLLLRGFIEVRGRADSPGKPLQYGTTAEFLDMFNLPSVKELPELREIKEILQEHEQQRLPRLRATVNNAPHVGQKSHVEHAVNLVEHEYADVAQM